MPEPGLGPQRAALVRISAALASRDAGALDAALQAAAATDPRQVEEALLQAHLFVGFPLALEALLRWRDWSATAAPAPADEGPESWERRGAEVCARVYGGNYPKLRDNVRALHPDLDRWMVEGGYGRVIGRPGLDLATRELCIAALLAVWDTPRQLHSHLRGALNAGATPGQVAEALEIAGEYMEPERRQRALELWRAIADGKPPSASGSLHSVSRA